MKIQSLIIIFFLTLIHNMYAQTTSIDRATSTVTKRMSKNYKIEIEKNCDLNQDSKPDKIFVFKNREKLDEEIEVLDSPIIILLSNEKGYLELKNLNILYSFIPNNSIIENNLVIKDNFFTIEQLTGNGNNTGKEYITCKYDKLRHKIILHRFSQELSFINTKNNKLQTRTIQKNQKDFGVVDFEKIDQDLLSKYKNN